MARVFNQPQLAGQKDELIAGRGRRLGCADQDAVLVLPAPLQASLLDLVLLSWFECGLAECLSAFIHAWYFFPSSRGQHDRLTTVTVGGRTDLGGAFGVLVVVVPVAILTQIVTFI